MKLTRLLIISLLVVSFIAGCGQLPEAPVGLEQFTSPGIDPETWALVPAGEFFTGQFNQPVKIDYDYKIMVTEVTNAQYVKYLNEALEADKIKVEEGQVFGYYPGDEFNDGRHEVRIDEGYYLHLPFEDVASRISFDGHAFIPKTGYENHPVTMVTWFGAKAYADFYSYRLPSELEWEKAARGIDNRPFPWGHDFVAANANFYKSGGPFQTKNGWSDTTPVGFYNGQTYGDYQTIDSPSPYGVYDMAGNVAEWNGDIWVELHDRIMKGGHKDTQSIDGRIWKRDSAPPDYCSPNVGFRCVRSI